MTHGLIQGSHIYFGMGYIFFPLNNELRKTLGLALGCGDVWEKAACTVSLQTGKERSWVQGSQG